jgi:SOS-response transcriptional repressor LexA
MLAMGSHNTQRIARVNPICIATHSIVSRMDTMSDRLREARKSAGYDSAQSAVDAFGWNAGAYRHHENGTRNFDVEWAKRYARAFKVNPGWLLAIDQIRAAPKGQYQPTEIELSGLVQAGVWRPAAPLPKSERYKVEVGPPPYPGAERFVVRLVGSSMDKVIPPESDLECLRVAFGITEPVEGDIVIVERVNHDLIEMTCKRLASKGAEWVLRAESTQPEFQEEIWIGAPDPDSQDDSPIRVSGIVLRSFQRHFRRA